MSGRRLERILLIAVLVSVPAALSIGPALSAGTWITQTSPTFSHLHGVYAVDASNAHAVGYDREALRTIDGGATWTVQTTPAPSHLWDVHFPTAAIGYAVGDSGAVIKTIDSGASWVSQTSPVLSALNAVFFADALTGYAVGDAGVAIATIDGGANWNTQTSNSGAHLRDVAFTNPLIGYAVGDSGVVIKTVDGGANWLVQATPTTEDLHGVSFPTDPLTGYAVGTNGVVVKTVDGGASWVVQATPALEELFDVSFVDNLVGFAVGRSSSILRTEDGGANWVVEVPPVSKNIHAVSFPSDGGGGWVVAETGVILRRDPGTASGSCYLIGAPSLTELSVTDLGDLNPATNESTIGSASGVNLGPAAVQPGTGTLFVIKTPSELGIINTGTAVYSAAGSFGTQPGALGVKNFNNPVALGFDPTDGTLYVVQRETGFPDMLFQADPATGSSVPNAFGPGIGYVEILSDKAAQEDFYGLVIDGSGQMRAMGNNGNSQWKLHEIDKTNGTALDVLNSSEVADLSYDVAGTLWGITSTGTLFDVTGPELPRLVDNVAPYSAVACQSAVASNQAPVFDQDLTDRSDAEGTAISISAAATDPNGDSITYSVANLPPGLTIDPDTGLISGTIAGSAAGTYNTKIAATDDGTPNLETADGFVWTVTNTNRVPVFDADVGDRTDPEGSVVSVSAAATDPDGDGLVYAASGLPAGVTIDAGSGLISGTISYVAAGSYAVVVTVTDDGSPVLSATDSFTWTVTDTNRVPVFDADVADRTDGEGDVVSVSAAATDPDGDGLVYAASGLPAGVTIDAGTGLMSGTISYVAAGSYAVVVTVTDDGSPVLDATDSFTWTVTDTNRVPVFDADVADRTDGEGDVVSVSAAATDPDGDGLVYAASGLPAGVTIDAGTGLMSGTISYVAAGSYAVVVTVTDDGSPVLDATDSFTWTVTNTNRVPVFDADVADRTDGEGDVVSVSAAATDPDGDRLVYAASGLPAGVTIDAGTGLMSGTISYVAAGSYAVVVTVTDDGSPVLDATDSFTWTVTDTNRVPVWSGLIDQVVAEGTAFSYGVSASDADGEALSFSQSGLPPWASLTDNGDGTATISGTPGYSASGSFSVLLAVTDGIDEVPADFELTITDTPRPPVAVDDTAETLEDSPSGLVIDVLANDLDPDGDVLTISGFDATTTMGGTVSAVGGTLLYRPPAEFNGADLFSYSVSDGKGGSDIASVSIAVVPTNDPPVIGPISDQIVEPGGALDVQLVVWDLDSPPGDLSYAIQAPGLDGVQIDGTGRITWTRPVGIIPGFYMVSVQVGDGTDVVSVSFGINVVAPLLETPIAQELPATLDQPVAFMPMSDIEVDENEFLELVFSAQDPDDPETTIRYEMIDGPPGAILDPFSGWFRWTPSEDQGPGEFVVTVVATSSNGDQDQTSLVVTVREVNSSPTLTVVQDRAVEAAAVLVIRFAADDADVPKNVVRFGLRGDAPTGAGIDPFTGVLTWNVGAGFEGVLQRFTVTATDEEGETASTEVTIRVIAAGTVAQRALFVDAVQVSASAGETPAEVEDSQPIVRTLVILGEAGSYTIKMLRIPLLIVAALILAFGTIGKITVGTAGRRLVETGVVNWFDDERGFGYIQPDSGEQPVFIHQNAIRGRQRLWFVPGARVKYRAIAGSHRAFVRWVRQQS